MIFSAAILDGIERRFSPLVGETWKKKRKNKEIPLIFVAHFVRWDHQRPTGKGYWKRYVPSFSHDFEMQIFTGKGILSSWECRNPIIVSTFFSGLVELIEKTGRGKEEEEEEEAERGKCGVELDIYAAEFPWLMSGEY